MYGPTLIALGTAPVPRPRQQPPNYASLATPTTISSAAPFPSGILCAGNNILISGTNDTVDGRNQTQPPYPGDYHGQKIAFSDNSAKIYAIGCNTKLINEAGSTLLTPAGYSFEACIHKCSETANCVGVRWNFGGTNCLAALSTANPSYVAAAPAELIGSNLGTGQDTVRYARLLTADPTALQAKVYDTIHYLGQAAGSNLGLCTGGNYDGAFINVQQRRGYFKAGRDANQLIVCNGKSYTDGGNGNQGNTTLEWNYRVPSQSVPTSPDACAKLCQWMYLENINGWGSGTNVRCLAWEWVGTSATDGRCDVWKTKKTAVVSTKTYLTYVSKVGVWAAGAYSSNNQEYGWDQTNGATAQYKRSTVVERNGRGTYVKRAIVERELPQDVSKPDFVLQV